MDEEFERFGVTPEELAAARRYSMTIDWSPEDEAFLVSFPDAPGVQTHAATREEAAERGEEAIVLWLTALRDAGRSVPPPLLDARDTAVARPARYDATRVQRIRRRLDVSQRVFADMLNVSLGTVRSWEQGRRTPDGASMRLLTIAEHHPEILLDAISPTPVPQHDARP